MPTHEFQHVLGQFEQICKVAGLKVTQQRLEIYRELLESEDHPAAETLHKRLVKRLPTRKVRWEPSAKVMENLSSIPSRGEVWVNPLLLVQGII